MKKNLFLLIIALVGIGVLNAQDFKKIQVITKNGITLKGSKGILTNESITFFAGKVQKTIPLSEVNIVQAKQGKAGKWALGMGGGCLAICLIATAAEGGKTDETSGVTYDTGTLIAGSILWAGIFAGVGALIGSATDHWENVYVAKTGFKPENLKLNLVQTRYAKLNIGLTYKF